MPFIALNTRTKPFQSGQAIVLIALLILVLFGMLGLAVDSGRAYVDRRDQQAAVDAAALAAGDWYENTNDLNGFTIPKAVQLYQNDLRIYSAATSTSHTSSLVGTNNNLPQDTYAYTFSGGYSLEVIATNTQFNGYEFDFTTSHTLPLVFIQIFGGSPNVSISATATAIVGNQRQTPALLTLSTGSCATDLTGAAQLTVLGDVYTNGSACLDANLHEAGNCYGGAGSNCNVAQYYCYNATPGFIPYPPPCAPGDTQGSGIVPAPTLPDPGYLAPSVGYYTNPQGYNQYNRGTWTEMFAGQYGSFHLTGGSASCAFLDPGVYDWTAGYTSDATGSLLSNELKAPDEGLYNDPNYMTDVNPQFWDQNGAGCSGHFTLSVLPAPGNGIKHQGGSGNWGVEVTSVRFDQFLDPSIQPDPCYPNNSCRRESAPSACQQVSTVDTNNSGIAVNITKNAPGAEYYAVYVNPNGCDGNQSEFGFWGRFPAPGFVAGVFVGPYPNGTATVLPGPQGANGFTCAVPTVTICNIAYNQLVGTFNCFSQTHAPLCTPPDIEVAPQCFSNCPPPANLLSQENAPMSLEYPPYTGGDLANENYCQVPPNPGDPNSPCANTTITPGAVQFYFPTGSCMTQNAQGATYVFSGEQYNWIIIYAPASNNCANKLNGGASTQYIGTIYTPGQDWTINGGNRSPLAGQVICYTAKVSGSAAVGIDYNPNYAPAPPAARLIN